MKRIELNSNHDKRSIVVVITVLLTLLCSYPYVFIRFFPIPDLNIIIAIELMVLVLVDSKIKRRRVLPRSFKSICVIQILFFVVLGFYHLDSFYIMRFGLFVVIAYYTIKVVNDSIGITSFVHVNDKWMTLQAVMGFLGFFLIISGILHPIFEYTTDIIMDYFYGITTTNSFAGFLPRIAGYFDEPGAFAQWGVYSLVLNKLLKGSKKVEMLLIVGLIVTFSLAYFIQLFLYFVVFYIKNIKNAVILVFLLLTIGVVVYNNIPEDSDLYYLTLRRMDLDEDTNRHDLALAAKSEFVKSPLMGVGYSNIINSSKGEVFDNPYETLATSGIFGTFAFYLPLLYVLLFYRENGAFGASLVLLTGYLQRPFHVQYIHYLMLYLFFMVCYLNSRKHKESYVHKMT